MGRQIYLPQQSIVAKTTKTTTVKISKRFRHWDPGHILQLLFANLYEKQTEVNTDCQQRELCAESLSCVQLFATPWAVAHQAPLSWNSPGKTIGVGRTPADGFSATTD